MEKSLPLNEEMRWKDYVSHFNKKDLAIYLFKRTNTQLYVVLTLI